MIKSRELIDIAPGVYALPQMGAETHVSAAQAIMALLIAVPNRIWTRTEVSTAIGQTPTATDKALWTLRQGGVLRPDRGVVALAPHTLAKIERGETIRDGRGAVLWSLVSAAHHAGVA